MFAVVLVGGFGTRLRPLTYDRPKPMLPIVGRPMIERLVERLAAAGATDVVLALGFQPGPFDDAFPGRRVGDARLHYVVEPKPLDTAGAIAFAARQVGVDETFLALNGDIISDLDIAAFIVAHRRAGAAATIHLTPVADPSAYGVVEIDHATGNVDQFIEKPAPGQTESDLISAGSYVLEPSVLDLVAPDRRVSIERDIFPALVEQRSLHGHATDGYWIDAGRPESYLAANLDLLDGRSGPAEPGLDPRALIDPTASIDRSVIGAGAVVGAGAIVRNSVLLPAAVIGDGATVDSSIVDGDVGAGASLTNAVVGCRVAVAAGAVLVDERVPTESTDTAS